MMCSSSGMTMTRIACELFTDESVMFRTDEEHLDDCSQTSTAEILEAADHPLSSVDQLQHY